jgi:iron complex transport system ATP-binding protein
MHMDSKPMIEVKQVSVCVSNLTLLNQVSFDVMEQDRLMIVGPNGAGKSTLVHAISQGIPYQGNIYYEGRDLSSMKPKQIARKIGFLSQKNHVNYSFTIEEIVNLGRYAYNKDIFSKSNEERELVEEALELTGLQDKRKQSVLTLSGGELQRTFLAQLLAQDPQVLILDEPTNHLDIQYQTQLFSLIDQWITKKKRAVVAVVHDLSIAAFYGNKFLLLDKGNLSAYGSKEAVLSKEKLEQAYQMDVHQWMQNLYKEWDGELW